MSFAATSSSAAACGRRALIFSAVAAIAGACLLSGGAGGAPAARLDTATTTTTLGVSSASIVTGQSVTLNATVTASDGTSPTGTVEFDALYTAPGATSATQETLRRVNVTTGTGQSTASADVTGLAAGSYRMSATYSSNGSLAWSTSTSASATVAVSAGAPFPTTMSFSADSLTIDAGQSVTFTTTLSSTAGEPPPSGVVLFKAGTNADDLNGIGQATLQNGTATFTRSGWASDTYTVVADYAGDGTYSSVSASVTLNVNGPQAVKTDTTVQLQPSTIPAGGAVTVTAHVVKDGTPNPAPGGAIVIFKAGPKGSGFSQQTTPGQAALDSNGDASVTISGWGAGTYTIYADYSGDVFDLSSAGQADLTVGTPTTVAYTGDAQGLFGRTATLAGRLSGPNSAGIGGRTLTLSLDGQTCTTGPTDASGNASCSVPIGGPPGPQQAIVSFAGDSTYLGSSGTGTFTALGVPTGVVYTGATAGATRQPATLSATLTNALTSAPVSGEPLTIAMGGESCTAQTSSTGSASCTVTPAEGPGAYPITATFAGDGGYLGSSANGTFAIAVRDTTVAAANATGVYGTPTMLTGTLLDAKNGNPVPGRTLTLEAGADSCTTGATDANGIASCSVPGDLSPATYTITAAFAGDGSYNGSSGTASLAVQPATTATTYTGATAGVAGAPVTVSAQVAGAPDGATVTFTLGAATCPATLSGGSAGCSLTPSLPGAGTVKATYAGDAAHLGSSGSAPFTTLAATTTTTYTGPVQSLQGSTITLTARVTGVPAGAAIAFALGAESCSGTVSNGAASCQVTLADAPGAGYTATATYAGDTTHEQSAGSTPFTVIAPATVTHVAAVAPVLAGSTVTLSATLSTVLGPLGNEPMTLSFDGRSCSATTSTGGVAACTVTASGPLGPTQATAGFAGDAVYKPSSDGSPAFVYGDPAAGAFVVGDRSATGSVTFWGAQWWKANTLSGGSAPASFKGWSGGSSAPACGVPWSTRPGNSPPPPAGPLPSYMLVVVSSAVAQSGSNISGTVAGFVIVKTDAGYDASPGHAGTGTVVATISCGS